MRLLPFNSGSLVMLKAGSETTLTVGCFDEKETWGEKMGGRLELTQYNLLLFAGHSGSSPTSSHTPSFPTGVIGISPLRVVLDGTMIGSNRVCGFGCDFSFLISRLTPFFSSSYVKR